MEKRARMDRDEWIILHSPTTLAFALTANGNINDKEVILFLILCYLYWFIIFIHYSKNVDGFVIMPSPLWKKAFLFICAPIGLMVMNMFFIGISISLIEIPLKIFGLREW